MGNPVVHGPGFSTYVRTVRMALQEKGVHYEHNDFNFLEGMPREQLERHPFGKVPAFEHDGFALYETFAICRYVDEGFDGPALQPSDARARARMTQVICVLDSYTYGPMVGTLVIQRLSSALLIRWGQVAAVTVLTIVPTIILFSIVQSRLVAGLTAGAVKE